jgi:PTS system cellobiose-specific IIC component
MKMNFSKYPEINSIAREINSLQTRLVKVRKVMTEVEGRKGAFSVLLQSAQHKIKDDFAKQILETKKKHINDLKRAKYFATDLKRLEQNYHDRITELNDACRYQMDQRSERQKADFAKLERSYDICEKEEKNILETIDKLKAQLKERWDAEKPKVKERRAEYIMKIKAAKKKNAETHKRVHRDSLLTRNHLIRVFKKAHPYYKFLRLRIFFLRWRNIVNLDPNLYDLVIKLNELKLRGMSVPRADKNNLINLQNEKRLNEGKSEAITFTKMRENLVHTTTRFMNKEYISALRGAFFTVMPFIFMSAFFSLINTFIFSTSTYGLFSLFNFNAGQKDVIEHFSRFGLIISDGINETFSLILLVALAWNMSKYYTHTDGFAVIFISLICMIAMEGKIIALLSGDQVLSIDGKDGWTGIFGKSQALIPLVVGLSCPPLYAKLAQSPRLRIHLPNDTPPIIAKTFNSFLPMLICVLIFAAFSFMIFELGTIGEVSYGLAGEKFRVYDLQGVITVAVLKAVGFTSNSLGNVIWIQVVQQLLWFVGIQPDPIIHAVSDPIFLQDLGQISNNTFTYEGIHSYISIGGSAASFAIAVAIILFSKRRDYRLLGWLLIVPSFFNITEPMAYGLPLTFNIIFLVPSLLMSVIMPIYVWLCVNGTPALETMHNLTSQYSDYLIIDNLPFFAIGMISSGNWWASGLYSLSCLVLIVAMYYPAIWLTNATEKQEFIELMIREKQREQQAHYQKILE